MVTVIQKSPEQVQEWADSVLPSLIYAWQHLPSDMREIGSWDKTEVEMYLHEWHLQEDQRTLLEQARRQDLLTGDQLAQLDELKELVAEHHAMLRRLLGC